MTGGGNTTRFCVRLTSSAVLVDNKRMDAGGIELTIPSWYELPSHVRNAWAGRIELLVPAPPLMTELTGPGWVMLQSLKKQNS